MPWTASNPAEPSAFQRPCATITAPWLAGLRLTVGDVNSTAGYLDAAGVRYLRDGDRLLRLGPDYACGVVIEFAAG